MLRRVIIDGRKAQFAVSARRACQVLQACRATYQYRARRDPQAFLRKTIRRMAEARTRYGYRRIDVLLRREGWRVEYHQERPYGTDLTPCKFLQQANRSGP
ncbi:MAG: hypothetical protein KC643_27585 [Nitrospira sp.]|nr:hypothetical protein [Nitrospira sp.]